MECYGEFTVFVASFEVSVRRPWRGSTTAADDPTAGDSTTIIITMTIVIIIITITIIIIDVSRGPGQRVASFAAARSWHGHGRRAFYRLVSTFLSHQIAVVKSSSSVNMITAKGLTSFQASGPSRYKRTRNMRARFYFR